MEPELTDVLCPIDDQPMIRRTGRFGPFLASSNYPEVQFILKLDPKKGHVVLPKTPPMTTEIICPKCNTNPYYVRDGKNGLWLSCSGFPKCRGRGSFKNLEDDVAEQLVKAWKQHEKDNPVPQVKTATGHVITDEEMYVPVVAGSEPVASIDSGDSTIGVDAA
ncbi:MAG: topoisomerase DNA-binding C4 zinc finger domain-containing protein [Planctomycetota bacterium]